MIRVLTLSLLLSCANDASGPAPATPTSPAGSAATTATGSTPPAGSAAPAATGSTPPAGLAPCAGAGSTPEDAALACYQTRIKPGLEALIASGRTGAYSFGVDSYLAHALTLTPRVERQAGTSSPSVPADLATQVTALGDVRSVKPGFIAVLVILRDAKMPTDGDLRLELWLDPKTLETVLAYRILGG